MSLVTGRHHFFFMTFLSSVASTSLRQISELDAEKVENSALADLVMVASAASPPPLSLVESNRRASFETATPFQVSLPLPSPPLSSPLQNPS